LQRIGRSGHRVDPNSVPKGRLFATTRDELIECAALVHAIRSGSLDALEIPPWPLDVLAQHIVSVAACEPWGEDDLFELVRRAVGDGCGSGRRSGSSAGFLVVCADCLFVRLGRVDCA
jgi:ATP-dependent Lhr-like helicase